MAPGKTTHKNMCWSIQVCKCWKPEMVTWNCWPVLVTKSGFILAYFSNELNNMAYTTTYFLLIPSTERHTRAIFRLLNVSLVSPCVKLYTALPVLIIGSYLAQGVLSRINCTWTYSPRPNPLVGFPIGRH